MQSSIVPLIYTSDGDNIVAAVDYKAREPKNLKENRSVALVVDKYGSDHGNKRLLVQGSCEILERELSIFVY